MAEEQQQRRYSSDLVKISFNLTPSELQNLRDFARRRGLSQTDTIRRALVNDMYLYDAKQEGNKLLLRSKNGELREIVLP